MYMPRCDVQDVISKTQATNMAAVPNFETMSDKFLLSWNVSVLSSTINS